MLMCTSCSISSTKKQRNETTAPKSEFQFEIDEGFMMDCRENGTIAIIGIVLKGKAEVGDYMQIPTNSGVKIVQLTAINGYRNDTVKRIKVVYQNEAAGLIFKGIHNKQIKRGSIIRMSNEK